MENAFGKIVSIMMLVIALFIVPVNINLSEAKYIGTIGVTAKTTEFIDDVRNTGVISKEDWQRYEKNLATLANGRIYETELQHTKRGVYDNAFIDIDFLDQEIKEQIYNNDIYHMSIGDYIRIMVYEINGDKKEVVSYYGGMIRNERA